MKPSVLRAGLLIVTRCVSVCNYVYDAILKNCNVKPKNENKHATSALVSTQMSPAVYVIVTSFIQGSFWHKWPRCSQKNALFCQVLLNFYVENGLWTQVDGLIWQKTSYSRL